MANFPLPRTWKISPISPKSLSSVDELAFARLVNKYGAQILQDAIVRRTEEIVGTTTDESVVEEAVPELFLEGGRHFHSLFDRHSAVMLLVDSHSWAILDANESAAEFYGYSRSDLRSKNIRELNSLSDDQIRAERANAVNEHRNFFHFPHRVASGEERLVEVHSSPMVFKHSKVLFSVIHDITERKIMERNLVNSEKKIRAIFDLSREFIALLDPNGLVVEVNKTALNFIGAQLGDIVGKPFWEASWWSHSPEVQKLLIDTVQEAKKGKFVRNDTIHLDVDGNPHHIDFSISPVFDDNGQLIYLLPEWQDVTEQKIIQEKLRNISWRFESIIEGTDAATWEWNVQTGEAVFNDTWARLLGYTLDELQPIDIRTWTSFAHPDDLIQSKELLQRHFSGELPYYEFDCRMKHRNGNWIWLRNRGKVITRSPDGKPILMFGTQFDITDRKNTLDLLLKIANRVPGLVYQFRLRPDGTSCFPFASEALSSIYRLQPEEVRNDASKVFTNLHPEDYDGVVLSIEASARDLTPWKHEYRVKFEDGTVRWLFGDAVPEKEPDGSTLWHGFITDITDRKWLQDKVLRMAFHDWLTGLPNRRLFIERLQQSMINHKRTGSYGAVLFIDLDNFKPLNDKYGHGFGDLLLIEAANRMKNCVREIDTVARFWGDEFVILLNDLDQIPQISSTKAKSIAEKILNSLSEEYSLALTNENNENVHVEHRCTGSIGIAVYDGDETKADDIIKQADDAMYRAKGNGRNSIWCSE